MKMKILCMGLVVSMLTNTMLTNVFAYSDDDKSEIAYTQEIVTTLPPSDGVTFDESDWIKIPEEHLAIENSSSLDVVNNFGNATTYGFDSSWQIVNSTSQSPYNTIASLVITLNDGSKTWGTGFVVGTSNGGARILTSAHNLQTVDNRYATSITAYFGKSQGNAVHTVTSSSYKVSDWWKNATIQQKSASYEYDYAVITVDNSVISKVGNFGMRAEPSYSTKYNLTGYPGNPYYTQHTDYSFNGSTMYTSNGNITGVGTNIINHSLYCWYGVSGSPLYSDDKWAIGIHSRIYEDSNNYSAFATRITTDVINFVNNS